MAPSSSEAHHCVIIILICDDLSHSLYVNTANPGYMRVALGENMGVGGAGAEHWMPRIPTASNTCENYLGL